MILAATKALSIRQPWAWAIVNGYKPVENRDWSTRFRGPVLIHAGKQEDPRGLVFVLDTIAEQTGATRASIMADYISTKRTGQIVGSATIIDCVATMECPWFFGPYGFVLANAKPIQPVPCRGMLKFFDVPADVLAKVAAPGRGG